MKDLLYRFIDRYTNPPRWMAFAFYKARINRCLYVIYPFHFVAAAIWWLQDRWARHTNNDSWIEREVEHRISARLKRYDRE